MARRPHCVFCVSRIEAKVDWERHCICLGCKRGVNSCYSRGVSNCTHTHAQLGRPLMCHCSFCERMHMLKVFFTHYYQQSVLQLNASCLHMRTLLHHFHIFQISLAHDKRSAANVEDLQLLDSCKWGWGGGDHSFHPSVKIDDESMICPPSQRGGVFSSFRESDFQNISGDKPPGSQVPLSSIFCGPTSDFNRAFPSLSQFSLTHWLLRITSSTHDVIYAWRHLRLICMKMNWYYAM